MVSVPSLFLVMVWEGRESSVPSSSSSAQSVRLRGVVSRRSCNIVKISKYCSRGAAAEAQEGGRNAYPAGRDMLAMSFDVCGVCG
jgi:hypothetical protein